MEVRAGRRVEESIGREDSVWRARGAGSRGWTVIETRGTHSPPDRPPVAVGRLEWGRCRLLGGSSSRPKVPLT